MSVHRPKLVVLGSGFGAFSLIRAIDVERYAVTVVSPRNHFLFTPLLPSTTVGTLEFRSIIEPIRTARRGIRFYQAYCVHIDPSNRMVYCEAASDRKPFILPYDILVIAVGAISNTFGVPGVKQHAFFLKELADARAIRQRIIECFESASEPGLPEEEVKRLLHFVVVGGGPTGVEFAAELHDFVHEDLRRWFPDLMPHVRITLLEATDAILTSFDRKLRDYALKAFRRNGIEVRLKSLVKEVRENAVVLADGTEIPTGLVIWSTGIGPTDLVRSLDFPKDARGRILVDAYLRVKGFDNVYALGDCATLEGENVLPTAQAAQQEGKYLAHALNARAYGKEVKPFRFANMGMLAYIGENEALADLPSFKGKGFGTWLFWRSAYLTKLVSWKNKMLVLNDWLRTSLFGRDISRF